MKKTLLMCGVLLAFAAPAFAQTQIDLTWSDCPLGAAIINVNNACSSNAGSVGTMVVSYQPPAELDSLVAVLAIIDFQTGNAAGLSPWWHMEPGGCVKRVGAVGAGGNFTANPPYVGCTDSWGLNGVAGFNYQPNTVAPLNGGRFKAAVGVVHDFAAVVTPDLMWYAVSVSIAKQGTVNSPCNAGCSEGACFVVNELLLSEPAPIKDTSITTGPQQWCTYNGTSVQLPPPCPSTPTHAGTWGSIKAAYR